LPGTHTEWYPDQVHCSSQLLHCMRISRTCWCTTVRRLLLALLSFECVCQNKR
jgi:hypothetical protein